MYNFISAECSTGATAGDGIESRRPVLHSLQVIFCLFSIFLFLIFAPFLVCAIIIIIIIINMQQYNINARVIADSIMSLHKEDLISNPLDDVHVTTELCEQGVSLGGANEGVGPTTQDMYI